MHFKSQAKNIQKISLKARWSCSPPASAKGQGVPA